MGVIILRQIRTELIEDEKSLDIMFEVERLKSIQRQQKEES